MNVEKLAKVEAIVLDTPVKSQENILAIFMDPTAEVNHLVGVVYRVLERRSPKGARILKL